MPVTLECLRLLCQYFNANFPLFSQLGYFSFLGNCNFYDLLVIIVLVINKSDSRCAVVRFCYHSYDYRPNWTPLSPITITNHKNYNFLNCDCFKNCYFPLIHLPSCYRTVCYRTVQQTNHIQSCSLNQPITTLFSITIETVYKLLN